MPERATVPLRGKMVQGDIIDFSIESENWNKYKLDDGTIIKLKLVVTQIVRTNEYNSKNEPIYVIASQNVISPNVPDKLMKKK